MLAPLLLRLRSQIGLSFSPGDLKESLKTYLTSGGFVLIRTIGKIVTYAVPHPAHACSSVHTTGHGSFFLLFFPGVWARTVLVRTFYSTPFSFPFVFWQVCAREAALLGTVASAAYNICFQLGTATTQVALRLFMEAMLQFMEAMPLFMEGLLLFLEAALLCMGVVRLFIEAVQRFMGAVLP